MPITQEQAQMITTLALACRPHGARHWDAAGVMANIRKISNWNLAQAIEHVIRHASDAKALSPGVIAKDFTPAAIASPRDRRGDLPPRKDEECPDHPGQFPPPFCAAHATEHVRTESDPEPQPLPAGITGADAARIAVGLPPKNQEPA